MRTSVASILLISLAAVSLGGCKSIFGSHRLHAADVALEGGSEISAVGQLAAGRQALDAGNYAAAITAFSNIRTIPGFDGDAYNGLAIAFAGLGRQDLAETYFRRAVAVSPMNERFRRNLARLEARAPAGRPDDGALAVQQKPASVRIAGLQVSDPSGRTARISPNEVFIRSDPAVIMWEPPARRAYPVKMAMVPASRRQVQVTPWWGRSYPARIRIGGRGLPVRAR